MMQTSAQKCILIMGCAEVHLGAVSFAGVLLARRLLPLRAGFGMIQIAIFQLEPVHQCTVNASIASLGNYTPGEDLAGSLKEHYFLILRFEGCVVMCMVFGPWAQNFIISNQAENPCVLSAPILPPCSTKWKIPCVFQ